MSTSTGTNIPRSTGPPKNRLPMYLGLGAAAVLGYYFYTSGGDPKLAKKEMKHDASRASTTVRDELPGRGREAKASAEEALARIGNEVDSTVREGKSRIADGQKALEQTKDRAGNVIMDKIDRADLRLEDEASKAKGWFSKK